MDDADVIWQSFCVECNWFLMNFFVSWIAKRIAAEATPVLTSKGGREARHARSS